MRQAYLIIFFFALHFFCSSGIVLAKEDQGLHTLQSDLAASKNPIERIEILLELSRISIHSDIELATKYSDEAFDLAQKQKALLQAAEVCLIQGRIALEKGKTSNALEKFEAAEKIAIQQNQKELEAKASVNLGYYWYRLGDSSNTFYYYNKSLALYMAQKTPEGIAQSHLKLGWAHDYFGNSQEAEANFQEAIDRQTGIQDTNLLINILHGMGAFYVNRSIKQHQAIQHFENALQLAQANRQEFFAGRSYNALGLLYASLGNVPVAKSFYLKGLEIFQAIDNKPELCWLYESIGTLALQEKNYQEALDYYKKALEIVNGIDRKESQKAQLYFSMGKAYKESEGNCKKALPLFQKALNFAQNSGSNFYSLNAELGIGLCNIDIGNYEEGRRWCELVKSKSQKHLQASQQVCNCLYLAHKNLGDHEMALAYMEEFQALSDSLHQEELSEKVNNLAAKQAYEKELAEIEKRQAIAAAEMKTRSSVIIASISIVAIILIFSLILAMSRKVAQKKQLQALANLRQQLFANISHDLRTPIAILKGYTETLLLKTQSTTVEERNKYLNIILHNTDRLSSLISQLFEYSKLEAKQIKPAKEHFQLEALIQEIVYEYQLIARNKGINIEIEAPAQSPPVLGDIAMIERVMQNLMDNAIKFTPPDGTINVNISTQKEGVKVVISDTGSGIAPEDLGLVFQRHKKAKSSSGAGLGLSIVKKILEMHGSTIHVDSVVNEGTQFSFQLGTH